MDEDLKVILTYLINDHKGETKPFTISVPQDYKEILYKQLSEAIRYINTLGYGVKTNLPDNSSWRGWDIGPNRQLEGFPEEYWSGRNHNLYQMMNGSSDNLVVLIVPITPSN